MHFLLKLLKLSFDTVQILKMSNSIAANELHYRKQGLILSKPKYGKKSVQPKAKLLILNEL